MWSATTETMPDMSQTSVRDTVANVVHRAARTIETWAEAIRPDRRVLVLGGARSGKSKHAESLIARHPQVLYVATGAVPGDDDSEWAERIRLHRERRPAHWETVETGDPASVLRKTTTPVLLDCLATWLTRVLDEAGAWEEAEGWRERVDERIEDFLDAWRHANAPVVAVSNEVGSGVVPATPSGRLFRDVLGSLNSRVAEDSDSVRLVVAGRVLELGRTVTS